eukprot:5173508-Amphidinium_carterae.1
MGGFLVNQKGPRKVSGTPRLLPGSIWLGQRTGGTVFDGVELSGGTRFAYLLNLAQPDETL